MHTYTLTNLHTYTHTHIYYTHACIVLYTYLSFLQFFDHFHQTFLALKLSRARLPGAVDRNSCLAGVGSIGGDGDKIQI